MSALTLKASIDAGSLKIEAAGELSDQTSVRLERELARCLTRRLQRVELDLEGVSEISDIGVCALRAWSRRLLRKAIPLSVRGARPQVAQALRSAGLDDILAPAHASRQQAA